GALDGFRRRLASNAAGKRLVKGGKVSFAHLPKILRCFSNQGSLIDFRRDGGIRFRRRIPVEQRGDQGQRGQSENAGDDKVGWLFHGCVLPSIGLPFQGKDGSCAA